LCPMYELTCPSCEHKRRLPFARVGAKARCPSCAHRYTIGAELLRRRAPKAPEPGVNPLVRGERAEPEPAAPEEAAAAPGGEPEGFTVLEELEEQMSITPPPPPRRKRRNSSKYVAAGIVLGTVVFLVVGAIVLILFVLSGGSASAPEQAPGRDVVAPRPSPDRGSPEPEPEPSPPKREVRPQSDSVSGVDRLRWSSWERVATPFAPDFAPGPVRLEGERFLPDHADRAGRDWRAYVTTTSFDPIGSARLKLYLLDAQGLAVAMTETPLKVLVGARNSPISLSIPKELLELSDRVAWKIEALERLPEAVLLAPPDVEMVGEGAGRKIRMELVNRTGLALDSVRIVVTGVSEDGRKAARWFIHDRQPLAPDEGRVIEVALGTREPVRFISWEAAALGMPGGG